MQKSGDANEILYLPVPTSLQAVSFQEKKTYFILELLSFQWHALGWLIL